MLKIIHLVLIITFFRYWVSGDCSFSNYKERTIFLQRYGTKTLLIPNVQNAITIPSWQNITAYCSGYFKDICTNRRRYAKPSMVVISCKGTDIIVEPSKFAYTDNCYNSNHELSCFPEENNVFEHPVVGCHKYSYVIADTVKNVPIIYSEICYDQDKLRTDFIHFVVADRSPVLEQHVKYNPDFTSTKIKRPNIGRKVDGFILSESQRQIQLKAFLWEFSEVVDFESHSLVPKGLTYPFFDEPNYGSWSEVFWWTPLRKGNWNLYEKLLKQKSKTVDIDVYAGTSHPLNFTYFEECKRTKQLKFDVHSKTIPVPLYIWNYVRQRNSNATIDVVIIGVNSPFIEDSRVNSADICSDICDTLDWLDKLKYTRHMPSLGLIFCCLSKEVKHILDGFPQMVTPTDMPDSVPTQGPNSSFEDHTESVTDDTEFYGTTDEIEESTKRGRYYDYY